MITATKDGVKKIFSDQVWLNLPEHKEGWAEVREQGEDLPYAGNVPTEVIAALKAREGNAPEPQTIVQKIFNTRK